MTPIQHPHDPLINRYWEDDETVVYSPERGLKPKTANGAFVKSWWATRWVRALTQWISAARLERGRQYARHGQVMEIDVQVGLILAYVQGTRPEPYRVRIEMRTFADAEWERIVDAMASQAIYAAQLLNGEMPLEIEDVFMAAGVSLFPSAVNDLNTSCTCPEWSVFCKHRAAVCYLVGEQLDSDPFLLFSLRGRTKEQVLAALRARRAARATGEAIAPGRPAGGIGSTDPTADPDLFWRVGPELQGVQVHVRSPEIEMELIRILGDPAFVEDADVVERLRQVYRQVSRRALSLAFDGSDAED